MASLDRQVCFNELSFCDKDEYEDLISLFSNYAQTIKALKTKGFTGIRYEKGIVSLSMEDHRNIFDLQNDPIGRTLFSFILSTARNPYIDSESKEADIYLTKDYEVNVEDGWVEGQGFTAAYLLDTITISLSTHSKWDKSSYVIRNVKDYDESSSVINISTPESSNIDALNQFIEKRIPLKLDECTINPDKKHYKFRDDHGKDKLKLIWDKLRNCNYIVSAINSLEFNPTGREFIEKCFEDGKIHIRLVNSDAGYGLVIQTTGKNMRETIAIGDIIFQKYS